MDLQIETTDRDGYTVLSPHGEIDFATLPSGAVVVRLEKGFEAKGNVAMKLPRESLGVGGVAAGDSTSLRPEAARAVGWRAAARRAGARHRARAVALSPRRAAVES